MQRTGSITRVGQMPDKDTFSLGPFRLFRGAHLLTRNAAPVRVPAAGVALLLALIDAPASTISAHALQTIVEGAPSSIDPEALIAALNQTLMEGAARHRVARFANGDCVLLGKVERLGAGAPDEDVSYDGLPALPSMMVGRDSLIQLGIDQMARHRLLTITGIGGVGKTTLAVAIAQAAARHFSDGVRFVGLAPLEKTASLASAVLTCLGLDRLAEEPHGESVTDLLARALADRDMLIVLDNCEHLIDEVSLTVEKLLKAPGVKVLATSREPLRCRGEGVLPVGPLDLPPAGASITTEEAAQYGAVRLFLEHMAWRENADAALTESDLSAVLRICRRLDGIPLALELAAAHVASIGLQQLMERLDNSAVAELPSGPQALARHQTLMATLDWSHALLSTDEQAVLRRLSVFRGDFAVDSALRVLGIAGQDEGLSLSALIGLQSKSLLAARVMQGAVHYRLLETTRDYAQTRLLDDPCKADIRNRHVQECMTRLEAAEADWDRMSAARWRVLYGRLISDVRAAIDWSFSLQGDPQLGSELLICSTALATRLELFDEYVVRLRYAIDHLDRLGLLHPKHELRLYVALRSLTANAMDTAGDFGSHERLLALAEALHDGDSNALAAWVSLWHDAVGRADYPQALSAARWHLGWATRHGDERDMADARRSMAYALHFLGDQQQAQTLARQVLRQLPATNRAQYFNAGQVDLRVSMRIIQARALWLQGRYRLGMDTALEAVQLAEQDGPRAVCLALSFAACPVALWNGDREQATRLLIQLQGIAGQIAPSPHGRWAQWFAYLLSMGCLGDDPIPPNNLDSPSDMQADLLVTMGCSWLLPRSMPRVERQTVVWCAPEVFRLQGDQVLAGGQVDQARRLYSHAISLARRWGLMAWVLRARISLARLEMQAGDPQRALALLRPHCGPDAGGDFNRDERTVRAVFAQAMKAAWP